MNLQKTYTISSSIILQTIDDESLLMDENTQEFFELNSSGLVFWNILKAHDNLSDAFNEMLDYFDISSTQLENDFSIFIINLEKQGIVKINEII